MLPLACTVEFADGQGVQLGQGVQEGSGLQQVHDNEISTNINPLRLALVHGGPSPQVDRLHELAETPRGGGGVSMGGGWNDCLWADPKRNASVTVDAKASDKRRTTAHNSNSFAVVEWLSTLLNSS